MPITVVVLPCVTCDLPLQMVHSKPEWTHLTDLPLADHEFGCPGWIDVFLGIEVFTRVLCNGQWQGPPGFPTTFNTNLVGFPLLRLSTPRHFLHLVLLQLTMLQLWLDMRYSSIFESLNRDQVNNPLYLQKNTVSLSISKMPPSAKWWSFCGISLQEVSCSCAWRVALSSCEKIQITGEVSSCPGSILHVNHWDGWIFSTWSCRVGS